MEILWIAAAYLIGSLPFGVLIAKTFKNIDPRLEGSKNPGATNVARLCGFPYGVMTLICDVLKGTIPVWMALSPEIFGSDASWFPSAVALAAVIGHVKSLFLGFHGGKGVATTIGVLIPLGIVPLLCAVACCLVVIVLSSYVSLGSLTLVSSLLVFYPLFDRWDLMPLALVFTVLIVWAHRENIVRLRHGQEKSWRKKKE